MIEFLATLSMTLCIHAQISEDCMIWPNLNISYSVDCTPSVECTQYKYRVMWAFGSWEQKFSKLDFEYKEERPSDIHVWILPGTKYYCGGEEFGCALYKHEVGKYIRSVEIYLKPISPAWKFMQIAKHEIGHALGLADIPEDLHVFETIMVNWFSKDTDISDPDIQRLKVNYQE